MFARLTPVLIALFAMIGVLAASNNCQTVCCEEVDDVSPVAVSR